MTHQNDLMGFSYDEAKLGLTTIFGDGPYRLRVDDGDTFHTNLESALDAIRGAVSKRQSIYLNVQGKVFTTNPAQEGDNTQQQIIKSDKIDGGVEVACAPGVYGNTVELKIMVNVAYEVEGA